MRDLRDPKALGGLLILFANKTGCTVREAADTTGGILRVPDHNADPGTLEKYGCPQDLPSTLPN